MIASRLIVVALMCLPSSGIPTEPSVSFCAMPGDRLVVVRDKCGALREFVEYTEEGEVVSYRATSGRVQAILEVSSGVVDLVRFKGEFLPVDGLRVGDTFSKVRRKFPRLSLVASAGEQGSIALADSAKGTFIVFDVSDVPTNWYFERPHDEAKLAAIKVVSVNLVRPSGR